MARVQPFHVFKPTGGLEGPISARDLSPGPRQKIRGRARLREGFGTIVPNQLGDDSHPAPCLLFLVPKAKDADAPKGLLPGFPIHLYTALIVFQAPSAKSRASSLFLPFQFSSLPSRSPSTLSPTFLGEGSPTEFFTIDYRKKKKTKTGTLILTSLLEDLASSRQRDTPSTRGHRATLFRSARWSSQPSRTCPPAPCSRRTGLPGFAGPFLNFPFWWS